MYLITDWIAKYEKMVEVWKKQAETADKVTAAIGAKPEGKPIDIFILYVSFVLILFIFSKKVMLLP